MSGWFKAEVRSVSVASSVELMKLSLLSTMSAIRGWFFSYTRAEYCAGIMTAPWIFPSRTSSRARTSSS